MLALKNRIFIDCETDGVRRRRRPWDIGWVEYDADGVRTQRSLLIKDIDLSEAESKSLTYGRFDQRHPLADGTPEEGTELVPEAEAARIVFKLLYNSVTAGIVVNFDTVAVENMLRRNKLCLTSWHHLVCVENQALAALITEARRNPLVAETHAELIRQGIQDRWKTDDIAAAFGVNLPPTLRHTGIGDAILAEMILTSAIVDGTVPEPGVSWQPSNEDLRRFLASAAQNGAAQNNAAPASWAINAPA